MPKRGDVVHEFLASYPPAVADLAMSLRAMIRRIIPEATETLDRSARIIGFGVSSGYSGLVCTIIPSKKGVKLGIVGGADLADPHRLMKGTSKRHRHIEFKAKADLERVGVEQLIRSALAAAQSRAGVNVAFGAPTQGEIFRP